MVRVVRKRKVYIWVEIECTGKEEMKDADLRLLPQSQILDIIFLLWKQAHSLFCFNRDLFCLFWAGIFQGCEYFYIFHDVVNQGQESLKRKMV